MSKLNVAQLMLSACLLGLFLANQSAIGNQQIGITKWRYRGVNFAGFTDADKIEGRLNELGAEGWEFATQFEAKNGAKWALFKRPTN